MTTPVKLSRGAHLLATRVDSLELSCEVPSSRRYGDTDPPDELACLLGHHLRAQQRGRHTADGVPTPLIWQSCGAPVHVRAVYLKGRTALKTPDWLVVVEDEFSVKPRLAVQIRAQYLWDLGPRLATASVMRWCEEHLVQLMGRRVAGAACEWKVSRIDLAADVAGAGLIQYRDLPRFTVRGRARESHSQRDEPASPELEAVMDNLDSLGLKEVAHHQGRTFTGFTFGKRPGVLARIYRKDVQLSAAGGEWLREHWAAAGHDPELHGTEVWRIEFELRSETLKSMETAARPLPREPLALIDGHLGDIWRYSTTKWLQLRQAGSAKRQSRVPCTAWWSKLAQARGFDHPDGPAGEIRRARTCRSDDPTRHIRQALQHLATHCEAHGIETVLPALIELQRFVTGYPAPFVALARGLTTVEEVQRAVQHGKLEELLARLAAQIERDPITPVHAQTH